MFARVLLHVLGFCAIIRHVEAQNQTFINALLSNLNGLGLTNFTSIIKQTQSDSSQIAFFLSLSDSSTPKTLFAPNNQAFENPDVNSYGYIYQPDSTEFLGALLLYHLVDGTYNVEDLGSGPNHTIITTSLQGHNVAFLEGDESQVIACGHSVAGFEIYNQLTTTAVISTTTFQHVTIHTLNAIIGIPGTYTFAAGLVDMTQFQTLQQSAGAAPVENAHGITIFAPEDTAFNTSKSQLANVSPEALFGNHIITGQTVWYDTFNSKTYTSQSGHNYSFALTSDLGFTVTLNGVTANIIRSDFLIDNGVIHLLDGVLSNTAPEPTTTSSSATSSSSSQSTSSSTAAQGTHTPGWTTSATSKSSSSLSGGAIAGIVVGVVAGIALVIATFLLWRRQRAGRPTQGYYDPPEPYTIVPPESPYTGGKSTTPMASIAPVMAVPYPTSNFAGSSSGSQRQARTPGEKAVYAPENDAVPHEEPQSPPQAQAQASTSVPPLSDEVVDHLLQRFAQRIDRGPAGDSEAPPMYPS